MHLMTTSLTAAAPSYKLAESLRDDLQRGDNVVLLDCRSHEDYLRGRIRGAHNIVLPQLMLRRLKANKLPLKNLVPLNLKQDKECFLSRISDLLVVVYDQYSTEINSNESPLVVLVHNRMAHEGCRVAILKGGYSKFEADYPEFCSSENQASSDADDEAGNSSSGSHSCEDTVKTNGQLAPPVLGLGSLKLCENAVPPEAAAPSPKLPSVTGCGLLARRSRRNGRKAPPPLTISSEGESENPKSTTSSSENASTNTPLYLSHRENPSDSVQNHSSNSSPSLYPTYGNSAAPAEILPGVFLGCARDASCQRTLAECNVTYILNVTSNLPNAFENDDRYHYKQIAISDHWSQNLSQFFPEAISFIDEARSKSCGVLVHCLAGISRSVTVTVAYLMQKKRWSLNEAYDFVKQRKTNVSPNFNFMGQLLDFEKALGITGQPDAGDSGISSSSSSNSPPTLFFTSPPPPTPSPLPALPGDGVSSSCGTGHAHKEHRSVFCLPAPMMQ